MNFEGPALPTRRRLQIGHAFRSALRLGAFAHHLYAPALVALVFFGLPIQSAKACSCSRPPEVAAALDASAAVFEGKALRVEKRNEAASDAASQPFPDSGATQWIEVEFAVRRAWKGDIQETLILRTASNSAACGRNFEIGRTYLVYATQSGGSLQDNLCSRTQSDPEQIKADTAILGEASWVQADGNTENTPAKSDPAHKSDPTTPGATASPNPHPEQESHDQSPDQEVPTTALPNRCAVDHAQKRGPMGWILLAMLIVFHRPRSNRPQT